jgi:hypothetical protein
VRVLVACEFTGVVRRAFRARGHDAFSADLLPAADGGEHLLCENEHHIFEIIAAGNWGLLIAHPECTYLCSSGLHWNSRRPGREKLTEKALRFVWALFNSNVPRIALENPQGCINSRLPSMPRPQYVQPYEFGHDASKKTGLWLKNLPPLIPSAYVAPRIVNGKPRWANQTDSGQNNLPPSEDRWKLRSETYSGIAEAMATQWGSLAAAVAA